MPMLLTDVLAPDYLEKAREHEELHGRPHQLRGLHAFVEEATRLGATVDGLDRDEPVLEMRHGKKGARRTVDLEDAMMGATTARRTVEELQRLLGTHQKTNQEADRRIVNSIAAFRRLVQSGREMEPMRSLALAGGRGVDARARMEVFQAETDELVAWMQGEREPFAGFARSLQHHVKAAVSLERSTLPGLAAAWHAGKAEEILAEAERRLAWERARN